jgi:hypothetical protein
MMFGIKDSQLIVIATTSRGSRGHPVDTVAATSDFNVLTGALSRDRPTSPTKHRSSIDLSPRAGQDQLVTTSATISSKRAMRRVLLASIPVVQ